MAQLELCKLQTTPLGYAREKGGQGAQEGEDEEMEQASGGGGDLSYRWYENALEEIGRESARTNSLLTSDRDPVIGRAPGVDSSPRYSSPDRGGEGGRMLGMQGEEARRLRMQGREKSWAPMQGRLPARGQKEDTNRTRRSTSVWEGRGGGSTSLGELPVTAKPRAECCVDQVWV